LLPGMFVRVQIEQGRDPDAIVVPPQAISAIHPARAKCSW
jgi:multidrug efflux pump subunit AcrA (membrane-fusion protein)